MAGATKPRGGSLSAPVQNAKIWFKVMLFNPPVIDHKYNDRLIKNYAKIYLSMIAMLSSQLQAFVREWEVKRGGQIGTFFA